MIYNTFLTCLQLIGRHVRKWGLKLDYQY